MLTVFPVHASADAGFANELAEFLEAGCDATCAVGDGAVGSPEELLHKVEEGLSADVLLMLLSPHATRGPWARPRWEPLFHQAEEVRTAVGTILLAECKFPELLRRKNFFDLRSGRELVLRHVKRWIWSLQRGDAGLPAFELSSDLADLYGALDDRVGVVRADPDVALKFAAEAGGDFQGCFWLAAHGRSLAQAAGELGSQLGVPMDGPAEENCRRVRELLSRRRCLVVLDDPRAEVVEQLMTEGRTSFLITTGAARNVQIADDLPAAQRLMGQRRLAEAQEIYLRILEAGIEQDFCARELIRIYEQWDRLEETKALREYFKPMPFEQLPLFDPRQMISV